MENNMILVALAAVGVIWIFLSAIQFVAEVISASKTRVSERQAIQRFCEEKNYCYFGCGGGRGHDSEYGGYNCIYSHK